MSDYKKRAQRSDRDDVQDPSADLENVNAAYRQQLERADRAEAEVQRLRELAATATRGHTRAIHALAGRLEYPEAERHEMGAYLTQELQRDLMG